MDFINRFEFELLEPRRLLSGDPKFNIFVDEPQAMLASRDAHVEGLLGSFHGDLSVAEYAARIDWGDGSESNGQILIGTDGVFEVRGAHDYATKGLYDIQIHVENDQSYPGYTETRAAAFADTLTMTLNPRLEFMIGEQPFPDMQFPDKTLVGSFFDIDHANGDPGAYRATVDWGDGTESAAEFLPSYFGGYVIYAPNHVYATRGDYTVAYTVMRDDGVSVATSVTANVREWIDIEVIHPDGSIWWHQPDCAGDIWIMLKPALPADAGRPAETVTPEYGFAPVNSHTPFVNQISDTDDSMLSETEDTLSDVLN